MKRKVEIVDLLKQCKKGRRKAQQALYENYYGRYYSLCNRYMRDEYTTQAVVNEGFFRVFTNLKSLKEDHLFEGWMKRIFINTCLEELKKSKKNLTDDLPDETTFSAPKLENEALANLAADELLELVKQLPNQMRTVFNLYVVDGFNHREISAQLCISEGTSKFHLSHARSALQKAVLQQSQECHLTERYD